MNNVTYFRLAAWLAVLGMAGVGWSRDASAIGPNYPLACLDGIRQSNDPVLRPILGSATMDLPYLQATSLTTQPVPGHRRAEISVSRVACSGNQSAVVFKIFDTITWTGVVPQTMLYPKLKAFREGGVSELASVSPQTGRRIQTGSVGNIFLGTTAALEISQGDVDLNRDFQLIVEDPYLPANRVTIDVPAFEPTPATFPDAYGARRLSGRYAGNYFDPRRPGEGIIVEIGDVPGSYTMHFLQFSWFTYDNNGKPFWLSGGGNFSDGDKRLHMPAVFRGGGRFAGAQAADTLTSWGTVDIEFSDCNTLQLGFAGGGPGFAPNVPGGTGELQWKRLTGISGYSCN